MEYIVDENNANDKASLMKTVCKANMIGAFDWSNFFDNLVRIVSFSSPDVVRQPGSDLLMWSHYADSGRGVRLEFELDDRTFPVKEVRYNGVRPKLDLNRVVHCDAQRDRVFADFLCDCILTKPRAWSYECEKRLVLFKGFDGLRFATPADEHKALSDRNLLLELPNTSLKEIAVGAKIENVAHVQDQMQIVRSAGFGHVRFVRAIFDESYAYKYVNLFNE